MLFLCNVPNSKIASHLRLNNVALAGIKPYITQNSVFLGDHSTACIGPSLPNWKNFHYNIATKLILNILIATKKFFKAY